MTGTADALTAAANAGTTAVRDAHRFDEARLARWMEGNVADWSGPQSVEQFRAANPTQPIACARRAAIMC